MGKEFFQNLQLGHIRASIKVSLVIFLFFFSILLSVIFWGETDQCEAPPPPHIMDMYKQMLFYLGLNWVFSKLLSLSILQTSVFLTQKWAIL